MKKNFSKLKNCVMAILGVLTLGVTALGMSSLPVQAENSVKNYTVSELTYFTAEGATVTNYKDYGTETNYEGMHSMYNGPMVEVTLDEDSTDFEITLNAKLDITKDFLMKQYWGGSTNPAKAVIYSYRSIADPTKVVNVISRYSTDHGGYASVLTLTDDYTFDANYHYVYLKGTTQWAVGEHWGDYIPGGYGRGGSLGSNLEGNICIFTSGDNAGGVRYNKNPSTWVASCYGDINSEKFLTASTKSLPADSEYRNIYTVEYVDAMLEDFATNGVIFSIKAIGVAEDAKFSFAVREYLNVIQPYLVQNTETLYVDESYTISNLIEYHTVYSGFLYGFYGVPEGKGWDQGGTYFENVPNKSIVVTTPGEYKILVCGRYDTKDTKMYTFTYNFVKYIPTVNKIDDAVFVNDKKHDLRSFFEITHLGTEAETQYVYTIDGVEVNREYISDGQSHLLGVTVTDKHGEVVSYEYEVECEEIVLTETISVKGYYDLPITLPVPYIPSNMAYSIGLYDEGNNYLTSSLDYIFETEGTYTVKYTFSSPFLLEKIEKSCVLVVDLSDKAPVITVNGEFADSYYAGKLLELFSATAANEFSEFNVSVKAFNGETEQLITDGKVLLTAGVWKIVYESEGVTKECVFNVVIDDIKPEIIISGAYATSYKKGLTITVLDSIVNDNSAENIQCKVDVYFGDDIVTISNGEFKLDKIGVYKIIYRAVDSTGNETEKVIEFTVEDENASIFGCMGCNSSIFGASSILSVVLVVGFAMLVLRRKGYENK